MDLGGCFFFLKNMNLSKCANVFIIGVGRRGGFSILKMDILGEERQRTLHVSLLKPGFRSRDIFASLVNMSCYCLFPPHPPLPTGPAWRFPRGNSFKWPEAGNFALLRGNLTNKTAP